MLFVAAGTLSVMFSVGDGRTVSSATVIGDDGGVSTLFPAAITGFSTTVSYSMGRLLSISFVFGLMICTLVFATGSISGGNLNPAVRRCAPRARICARTH